MTAEITHEWRNYFPLPLAGRGQGWGDAEYAAFTPPAPCGSTLPVKGRGIGPVSIGIGGSHG
jgi:hypothetical protein